MLDVETSCYNLAQARQQIQIQSRKITVASLFGLRPFAVPRPELRNLSNLTNFGRRWRGEGEGSIDSCVSAVENQVFGWGVGGGVEERERRGSLGINVGMNLTRTSWPLRSWQPIMLALINCSRRLGEGRRRNALYRDGTSMRECPGRAMLYNAQARSMCAPSAIIIDNGGAARMSFGYGMRLHSHSRSGNARNDMRGASYRNCKLNRNSTRNGSHNTREALCFPSSAPLTEVVDVSPGTGRWRRIGAAAGLASLRLRESLV